MNIISISKKIAALCKTAARVMYDYEAGEGALSDDFIYISEEHTVYRIPASVDVCAVFDKLFEARRAAGRHGMDLINEGTAKKCYNAQFKENAPIKFNISEKITAEVLTFSGKLKAGWRFLDDPDSGAFRAVNTKFMDVFAGFEYIATADDKRSNYPFFVSVPDENVTALILPFSMDRSTAEAAIKEAAELEKENAQKIKGVYFDGGIYSAFIAGGRKDQKTAEKIIMYLGGLHNWDEETIKKAISDPSYIASVKKSLINVTAEKKTLDEGETYYYSFSNNETGKKCFWRSEAEKYTRISDGFFTFIYGKAREAIDAAEAAEVKTETAAADQEPAEAADDITTEPAEDIPAEAADDPADQEPPAETEEGPAMPSSDEEIIENLKARRHRLCAALAALDPVADSNLIESIKTDLAGIISELIDYKAITIKKDRPAAEIVSRALSAAENATKNTSAIIKAGIAAEAFTAAELLDFVEKDILPAVHTFSGWMAAGYTVKKGEKALFKADIWQKFRGTYYKHTAAFFGPAQVEAIPEGGK